MAICLRMFKARGGVDLPLPWRIRSTYIGRPKTSEDEKFEARQTCSLVLGNPGLGRQESEALPIFVPPEIVCYQL